MKRILILTGILLCTTASAQTLLPGSQINRIWPLTNNGGQSGLEIPGTLSGSTVTSNTLRSSGSLVWEGSASGAFLWISSLDGSGLTDCDTAGSSKLLWDASTKRFSCGSDQNSGTSYTAGQGLTLTSSAFSVNATLSGSLIRFTTVSGSTVFAKNSLLSSGSLAIESSLTGATMYGFGLPSGGCSGTTSKLLWDAATGKYSCGTDTTGDAGQGLTKAGSTFSVNGTLTGSMLRFLTVSGALVKAKNTLASSGTLVWETSASGASLWVSTFEGAGLTDCDAATQTLAWDATSKRFSCGSDADTNYSAGQNLTLSAGNAFALNTTVTGALLEFTTVSGALTYGKNTVASSGSLVWEGAASGATLNVSGQFTGVGLVDCDTAGTSKLLYDLSTGRFSCGSDVDTNTTYTAGQNINLSSTSFRLNTTVTGSVLKFATSVASSGSLVWEGAASGSSLTVSSDVLLSKYKSCNLDTDSSGNLTCGSDANTVTSAGQGLTITSGLITLNAFHSGSTIWATQSLRSSGALTWEGAGSGATLYLGGKLEGAGLADCDTAATSKLLWDATTGRFSCGTDQNTGGTGSAWSGTGALQTYFDPRYVNTSGDTMTGALVINMQGGTIDTVGLRVINTFSGAIVQATQQLRSSGSLAVEGGAFIGADLSAIGFIEAGSDIAAGGDLAVTGGAQIDGSVLVGTDLSVNGAFDVDGLAFFRNTASGNVLHAEKTLTSSGKLVFEGAASGSSLFLGTSLDGAGLTDCDTSATSKLLWDATNKRFSCGTDQTVGSGLSQSSGDERYVNQAGDTMTGALVLNNLAGASAVPLSISGVSLQTGDFVQVRNSTGVALFRIDRNGTATINLNNSETGGLILTQGSRTDNATMIDSPELIFQSKMKSPGGSNTVVDFGVGVDAQTTFGSAQFRIRSRSNGGAWTENLQMAPSGQVTFPNTVLLTGKTAGGVLFYNGSSGVIEDDANFFWDDTLDRLGLGTTGPKAKLDVVGTASGSFIRASTELTSSGVVIVEGAATFNSTLTVAANAVFDTNTLFVDSSANRVGIGTTSPDTALDVVGTISGSNVVGTTAFSPMHMEVQVFNTGSSITTGSGKAMLTVSPFASGYNLVAAHAAVRTAGTTNTTNVHVTNLSKGNRKILSTPVSIDSGETGSDTGAASFVVNTANDDVGGYDRLSIDLSTVSTTPPKGLTIMLIFRKP